ncbi:zeta toxin family protein [Bordetella sp. 15P40C-2]|uniref:zeta toxin family protein n=1 Tax=Bordetella sp. 15P40C-2 TaxID=2572246 RepID=UPI001920703A|nr:zeta toxin family protein [Bordetella sp. 15P40C-2]
MISRPVLYVLAGVNGAGKSSIGGHQLTQAGLAWYNPDSFARELVNGYGYDQEQANAAAWSEGVRRLDQAIDRGQDFAFETTLGGFTISAKLAAASSTHDVMIWFCGLQSPEHHIARVKLRVSQGGHAIAEEKIRQRYRTSVLNLIALIPYLHELRVYDNSHDVKVGEPIPEPKLLLYMSGKEILIPGNLDEARLTPDWAIPILEAAYQRSARPS